MSGRLAVLSHADRQAGIFLYSTPLLPSSSLLLLLLRLITCTSLPPSLLLLQNSFSCSNFPSFPSTAALASRLSVRSVPLLQSATPFASRPLDKRMSGGMRSTRFLIRLQLTHPFLTRPDGVLMRAVTFRT